MRLSNEEQRILEGGRGEILARYMDWLVCWGDAMGAQRLIPVNNVQVSGISAPGSIVSGASEEVIERTLAQVWEFTEKQVVVPTCSHVARMSLDYPNERNVSAEMERRQQAIIHRAKETGIKLTWTCAPYIAGVVPQKGEVCAWTESSAVVYINSMLGARSTRNGSESAIAAATLGKVPEFGVLLDEGRKADLVIDVTAAVTDLADWGALGYWTGEIAGLETPVFTGLSVPSQESAKQLSATLATSGGVTMFHIAGVTPEAPDLDAVVRNRKAADRYTFGANDLDATFEQVRTLKDDTIDYVVLGCPHATIEEIRRIAELLVDRHIADSVAFEVWTPFSVRALAQRLGYIDIIEHAGGRVLSDTCPAVSRVGSGRAMVTNSFKQAHYAPGMIGVEVAVGPLDRCVEAAIQGKWTT